MSLLSILKPKGPSGFGYGSTAEEVTEGLSLGGKTILLTGCNSGLGLETLRVFALRGAKVLGAARTLRKAQEACATVGGETVPLACELSDPDSVRSCIQDVQQLGLRLDAIVCNAGIMAPPTLQKAFGYELQFFTNHLGHFILVTGLLGSLSDAARIVMLSSRAHRRAPENGIQFDNLSGEKGYSPWIAYGQSKFANLLFAKELSHQFSGSQRIAVAVHPGVIHTNLSRHMNPVADMIYAGFASLMLKSVAQGAATECWAAVHPDVAQLNGEYLADNNVTTPREDANNPELAHKLWKVSEEIVAQLPSTRRS